MKKVIGRTAEIASILLICLLLYLNIAIHTGPHLENREEASADVSRQLNFLEDELKNENLGNRMQNLFPEGFVFVNALYGITRAELALAEKEETVLYQHALSEARFAYGQVNSVFATRGFDQGLNPKHGIFYCGWKNYLLGKILSAQLEKDSQEKSEFSARCEEIAIAVSDPLSPYPESYFRSSWPADAFVAVASLKLYGEIADSRYDSIIKNWISRVKARLDPETGLIPHSADADSGKVLEGARGSSICLMLIFLAEIDPEFALQQFGIFKERFLFERFGLPAVREYPSGKEGEGDIDSGPVILDIGFAGTIVSVGTFQKFGEYRIADKISANIESFGFAKGSAGQKEFLFGHLPMADAFIAWSRIAEPAAEIIQMKGINIHDSGSVSKFHLISILIILILLLFIFRKKVFHFFR